MKPSVAAAAIPEAVVRVLLVAPHSHRHVSANCSDKRRCVKNLKSFGFVPPKGTNKILISSLSKEKIKKLANLRVIQKTLVYVIGIAPEIATEEILKTPEYFGQYGDLLKVVVNTNNVYNATRGGPSYSAYLTYSHPRESAIAILVSACFIS